MVQDGGTGTNLRKVRVSQGDPLSHQSTQNDDNEPARRAVNNKISQNYNTNQVINQNAPINY
jgi:hypothetical protein